ncbi:MAG: hypothetical protein E7540_04720 [Ruminococcaceae bacterium]|nr:hypothetical protein [Oscillospiraceae bacterium]
MIPQQIPRGSVVKSTVRASLKDKYVSAVIAALSPMFAFLTIYFLGSIWNVLFEGKFAFLSLVFFAVSAIFVVCPIVLGSVKYFWIVTEGGNPNPAEVFCYFGSFFRYKRAIKTTLLICFRLGATFFVCLLPYFIVMLLSNSWLYQFLGTEIPLWVTGLVVLESFLRIAGFAVALFLSLKDYLALAVIVMDDDMLLLEAFHISAMVSRRSYASFIGLVFSLLFWIIVSVFVVPIIYTAPLMLGCYAVHSRYALVNYNMNLDYYSKE